MKWRLEISLDDDLHRWLDRVAARPGSSKTAIVSDALRAYLARGAAAAIDPMLRTRLDKVSEQLDRFERNQHVLLESLGLFVRHELSLRAPLPESQQAAARAQGQQRFATFVEEVVRRIARGRSLADEVFTRIKERPSMPEAAE